MIDDSREMGRVATTHVGSSIRPPALIALCLKESVTEIVNEQVAHGVDIVSDGEFGKPILWAQYALTRLGGAELRADVPRKVGSVIRARIFCGLTFDA